MLPVGPLSRILYKKTLLLARLESKNKKKKRLLQITSGCVKEVKLGVHGRQLKSSVMEKDGIKIDISKREDITSAGTVCITDYDSWPSDQNPHGRRAAVRSTRDHRLWKVLREQEDASSLLPLKWISTDTLKKGLVKPKPPGPTHRAACFSNALIFTAAIQVRTWF